jgi:hypothetical protein
MDLGGLGEKAMRRVVRRGIIPIGGRYGHALDMCWMPLVTFSFFLLTSPPRGLPLGPSFPLSSHPLYVRLIGSLISAYLPDSVDDSYSLTYVTHATTDTSSIRTMTSPYYSSYLTWWLSKYWY